MFEELIGNAKSYDKFINSLENNYGVIYDFYSQTFDAQLKEKDNIECFVLTKHSILSKLDFSILQNKSFILILLDLCERFRLYSCVPHILKIITKHNICINLRLKAALKFIYPAPKTNQELIDKVDDICDLLQNAINSEEDNENKSLVTLLNYIDNVLYDTSLDYYNLLHAKLVNFIEERTYPFIFHIKDVINYKYSNSESLHIYIQKRIDSLQQEETTYDLNISNDFIIEENTCYCKEIEDIEPTVKSIRNIALSNANGILHGRGTNIITTEEELFEYMKRFGKMHYAKLMYAFSDPFPQKFEDKIDIIDWGCGQALATITFIEKFGYSMINSITLVEPSEIALRRAALHCTKFAPNVRIYTICKKMDDLMISDFKLNKQIPTVNLFSNILDIDDYIPSKLNSLVLSLHCSSDYYVCVSPYINEIKTGRIDAFKNQFIHYQSFKLYHDKENSKYGAFWMCNNNYGKGRIRHGFMNSCDSEYDENGCVNKWTRVIKVFSI